eukprot:2497822-Pyramimonas_sp.AAC.1
MCNPPWTSRFRASARLVFRAPSSTRSDGPTVQGQDRRVLAARPFGRESFRSPIAKGRGDLDGAAC